MTALTMPAPSPVPDRPPARLGRWVELALVFAVAPGALSLGPRWLVLPAILTGGLACLILLLADPTFSRRRLFDAQAARRGMPAVLVRTLVVWTGLLLFAMATRGPAGMFLFPRSHPGLWLAVALLYPIFSVYPQELMYRTFFFHRYRDLFRTRAAAIVTNAVLFGWAHVIVHNFTAVVLTALGGPLFAYTYDRARSTLLVAAEHALYGDFVFSVGIGGMFVNGVRLLSKVLR